MVSKFSSACHVFVKNWCPNSSIYSIYYADGISQCHCYSPRKILTWLALIFVENKYSLRTSFLYNSDRHYNFCYLFVFPICFFRLFLNKVTRFKLTRQRRIMYIRTIIIIYSYLLGILWICKNKPHTTFVLFKVTKLLWYLCKWYEQAIDWCALHWLTTSSDCTRNIFLF